MPRHRLHSSTRHPGLGCEQSFSTPGNHRERLSEHMYLDSVLRNAESVGQAVGGGYECLTGIPGDSNAAGAWTTL